MTEGAHLLAALQLGDSAFPVGGFALSHGLETAVEEGFVRDLDAVERYLESVLLGGLAGLDLVALLAAHGHAGELDVAAAWDRALHARKPVRETREASRRAGRALLRAGAMVGAATSEAGAHLRPVLRPRADLPGGHLPPGCEEARGGGAIIERYGALVASGAAPGMHPVAHGIAAAALGLAGEPAALVFGHAFLLGGLSAAVRLLPIDHLAVQAALVRLRVRLLEAVARAARLAALDDPDEMGGFAPTAELWAMQHEHGPARAFAT